MGLGLFILNQPRVTDKLLKVVISEAMSEELQVTYRKGSFTLFEGISFDDLRVSLKDGKGTDLEIEFKKIEIVYDLLTLLKKEIFIEKISVVGARISGRVALSEDQEEGELPTLPLFLKKIELKKISVADLKVDLKVDQENFLLRSFDLDTSLSILNDERLELLGKGFLRAMEIRYGSQSLAEGQVKFDLKTAETVDLLILTQFSGIKLSEEKNINEIKLRTKFSLQTSNDQLNGESDLEMNGERVLLIQQSWELADKIRGKWTADATLPEEMTGLKFKLNGKVQTQYSFQDLALRASSLPPRPLEANLQVLFPKYVMEDIVLSDIQADLRVKLLESQEVKLVLDVQSEKMVADFLKKEIAWQLKASALLEKGFAEAQLESEFDVESSNVANLKLNFEDQPQKAQLSSKLAVNIGRHLDFVLDKSIFDRMAEFDLDLSTQLEVLHRSDSVRNLDESNLALLDANINLQSEVRQKNTDEKTEFILGAPLQMNWQAKQREQRVHLTSDWTLPPLSKPMALKGGQIALQASADQRGDFVLKRFHGSLSDHLISFDISGKGNYESQDLVCRGEFEFDAGRGFEKIPGFELSGRWNLPWSVVMRRGRTLEAKGEMRLSEVSLSRGQDFAVEKMSGSILFNESLAKKKSGWQLAKVLQRNPFEKVDFDRFQPFLEEASPLSIEKLKFEEVEVGPLSGFFSLRQNLISARRFYFQLARGEAAGEFFMDLYPQQRALGLLARVTNLQLKELIPRSLLGKRAATNHALSGRVGMVYQTSQGTLGGRLDITEIGKEQVLSMIDVLDPHLEDENLNKARDGLAFGYPKGLYLGIDQGILDFDLRLGGLAGGFVEGIRSPSIPISGLVSKMSNELESLMQ